MSSLYASLLTKQDTIQKDSLPGKTLEELLANITLTISTVEKTINDIKKDLEQDFNAASKKPKPPRPTHSEPLYVSVKDFKDLLGFLNLERAMQDFDKVNNELSNCSASFKPKQEESVVNKASSSQKSCLFTQKTNKEQKMPQSDVEQKRIFPKLS